MARAVKHKSWPKRILWAVVIILLLLVLAAIALRVIITTAPGSRFIEGQINKRSFGPVEGIEISGLSGDPFKQISIGSVALKDKNGVWLRAQGVDLTWKPFAYFKDHVWIQDVAAAQTDILRRPVLNAVAPREAPLKFTLESFGLARVNLDESLIGQAASLDASGKFILRTGGAITAKINASRLDVAGDNLDLEFARYEAGTMQGVFEIAGAADGPIATLLKAPSGAPISGNGVINGTDVNGNGTLGIRFGDSETISVKADWADAFIQADANINLANWPAFDAVRARLGNDLKSKFRADRGGAKAFTASLNVPGLSADASGNLPDNGFMPARASVDARTDYVSKFAPLPDGYSAGRGSAKGLVNLTEPYAFDGRVTIAGLKSPYGSAQSVTGPLTMVLAQDTINFKTDFAIATLITTLNIPIDLAAQTQLKSTGRLNMDAGILTLQDFNVVSGTNKITGQGTVTTDAEKLDLKGNASVQIKAAGSIPEGQLKADYALKKTPNSLMALTTDGAFAPGAPLPEPFAELAGERLIFKAAMTPIDGGVRITDARINGDNARAAIAGTFGEAINLTGEAIVSAPVTYKSVSIDGGAESSFVLTGTRTAPTLRLDAKAGSVAIQNYTLEDARLRAEITDLLDAPKGPIQIDATSAQGLLSASAQFASKPGVYIANDLDVTWGRLTAGGGIRYPQDGIATGKLSLRLPENAGQYARANLVLSNSAGEQGVSLTADAKQIEIAGFNFDSLTANADGTLAALTGNVQAEGQRGQNLIARRFEIDAPVTVTRSPDQTYTATLNPTAKYGDIAVNARQPITASYKSGDVSIKAPLAVSDGTVDLLYQRGAQERLQIDAAMLPVTLIPMPGNLADTRGRMSADIELSAPNNQLQGGGVITLTDWRGFDVQKEQGLTGTLRLDIQGREADVVLTAASPAGFKADGRMRLPLASTENLTGARLNMDAPINGTFTAAGAAKSVFGLATPSDAELGGTLSANIKISGTANAPRVDGQAGGADIKFEAPELGTRVRQGRFTANFTNDSLSVRDVYVADGDDGTLIGQGEFKLGEFGRPLGKLDIQAVNFRALDRRDVEARVAGNLDFVSEAEDATLSGDVTIKRADVKQFVTGGVSVIEIPVEEINKPDTDDTIKINAPATPIKLNVRVRAPRRIFVRSRGIDVELSVDATIKGTLTEPLFYGEAKVLRGGYKLAGKTLDFKNGTIKFEGDLPRAKIDFLATTETQNLDAKVTIKGTVEKPEIELSSSPERPQDEILSALLFGRSATELSTIEAAQLAGALAQMSGSGGGFDLLGGLRDAFGIGQLSVNFNPDGSAQLVGGRYLAKNVYLQVFSGAGPDQTGAIIDWEIRKNIALRSRIRADNDQALSLKWKRDF